jgi:AcrR family transcriptional regulator
MASPKKPPRRTREKILELSLSLYNDFGEPNVTTTTIADSMGISPGNLYYHFRNKDEITEGITQIFEQRMEDVMHLAGTRKASVEDGWLFLHLLFELIWEYRFLYRDLNDLLARNRNLELLFKRLMSRKVEAAMRMLDGLQSAGSLEARPQEREALAVNMAIVTSYWLSWQYLQHARQFNDPEIQQSSMARGAYQVLSLVNPYLRGPHKELFERLAREYLLSADA